MATRTIRHWSNSSRVSNNALSTIKVPIWYDSYEPGDAVRKGSMIKIINGQAYEVASTWDHSFHGVAVTRPYLEHDGVWKITVMNDPNATFIFALSDGEDSDNYYIGQAVKIGGNCQCVQAADIAGTPDVGDYVGRISAVASMYDFFGQPAKMAQEIMFHEWPDTKDILNEYSNGTPVFNYDLVEVKITGVRF